ncbi:putative manganese-dependent inorganic diphosphatase [uncultured Peptoniphilus sp.]|uniref:putative manganese-dependent inorganic diphosphatase n=1 Tax=uncultured Peptoniphilus sp. TaxID=254354 RepID=UPI002804F1E1|nr:putative manganese-dependent inorganic diphosphatase [uncultured Peptoniphilus sp.]
MIYITGHKKPDTDSIVSSIAYSYLKNMEGNPTEPIRLGELNLETKFILDYFNIEVPELKEDIFPRAIDINMDDAIEIEEDASIFDTLDILQKKNYKSAYVVDKDKKMVGLVTMYDIMDRYLKFASEHNLEGNINLESLSKVLSGKLIKNNFKGIKPETKLTAYAMDTDLARKYISPGDVVIVGDRYKARKSAIEMEVSLMILVGGIDLEEDLKKLAKEKNVSYILTDLDTVGAAKLIPLATSIDKIMKKDEIIAFYEDQEVSEIKNIMKSTRFRQYPVLNRKDEVLGSISRFNLLNLKGHDLILVDHNEKTQSIDGIETANVLEIIDHHRVQSVPTNEPIYFRNEPVGSTATIVSKIYLERLVNMPKEIAGILMAGIISDTLFFKSPTTTETDKKILKILEEISGIDSKEFAKEMFKAGTSLKGKTVEEILNIDQKKFNISGYDFLISQVFTMDDELVDELKEDISRIMKSTVEEKNISGFVTIVTNILDESSKVFIESSFYNGIKSELNPEDERKVFEVKGLLSRKKQLLPAVTRGVDKEIKN